MIFKTMNQLQSHVAKKWGLDGSDIIEINEIDGKLFISINNNDKIWIEKKITGRYEIGRMF